jgi:aminoglycoside/choline kinase family phosphotransferase
MEALWRPAVDVLLTVRDVRPEGPVAIGPGIEHVVPPYDQRALLIETELLLDWYWPLVRLEAAPPLAREEFLALWRPILDRVLSGPRCLTLRDYHSPNLIALSGRGGEAASKVGILDFQDAVIGHPAYDLVSLLQDARLDVPIAIERRLLAHYCMLTAQRESEFDEAAFRFAYAALGAQRNTKILGIFARLFGRDGKPQYLSHLPRVWRYLARDLDHPGMSDLKGWYDCNFPADFRERLPTA